MGNRIACLRITRDNPFSPFACSGGERVGLDSTNIDPKHRQPHSIGAKPKTLVISTPVNFLLVGPIKNTVEQCFGTIMSQLQ